VSEPSQTQVEVGSYSLQPSRVLVCTCEPKHTPSRPVMCQGVSILVPSVKLIPPQLLLEDTARDGQESFAIFLNLIQSFLIKICDEFVDPEACSNNQREREREREEGEEGGRR
jgi:hypothetical protein